MEKIEGGTHAYSATTAEVSYVTTSRGFCAGCKQVVAISYPPFSTRIGYTCPNCGLVSDWNKLAPLANEAVRVLCEMAGIEVSIHEN